MGFINVNGTGIAGNAGGGGSGYDETSDFSLVFCNALAFWAVEEVLMAASPTEKQY